MIYGVIVYSSTRYKYNEAAFWGQPRFYVESFSEYPTPKLNSEYF